MSGQDHHQKPTMLAICPLPDPVKTDLRTVFDVDFLEILADGELNRRLGAREILVVSFGAPLTRDMILALPRSLRAIATYSVGYDHIDVAAAKERGLPVFNTPDVLTDAVAETGLFLMLGAARRATESIDLIRQGRWTGWSATQLIGTELKGKALGILGMGRIGRGIAERARAFGMTIHYCNRRRLRPDLEAGAVYHADFDRMAGRIDVLMIAAHSNPGTQRYLDAARIARLKHGAIVANIARGELIDDDALIAALTDGRVRAAGLDVFAGEPRFDPRYLSLPNVFMLPHIGSSTIEARRRMGQALIAGLVAWRSGGEPENRVV